MLLIQYPVHDRQNNIYVDYVTAVQFRMNQYISGTGDNSRGSTIGIVIILITNA